MEEHGDRKDTRAPRAAGQSHPLVPHKRIDRRSRREIMASDAKVEMDVTCGEACKAGLSPRQERTTASCQLEFVRKASLHVEQLLLLRASTLPSFGGGSFRGPFGPRSRRSASHRIS